VAGADTSLIDRRLFLRGTAAAAATLAQRASAQESRPPNILFLLADQWRGQALALAGDPNLKTPALARLAAEGIYCERAYTANPECSPSRATILTGRYPHVCGVFADNGSLPLTESTIAELLRSEGYVTGYIGKWHLDGEAEPGFVPPGRRRHGFDYWAAFNRGHRYDASVYFRDDDTAIRGNGFEPDYQTGLAIEFLHENAARPFFLCLSWGPPHPPRTPPLEYRELYEEADIRLRRNVPGSLAGRTREALAGYYGLCSAVDANVARLLETLEDTGLARDTIVVFTSDHGDMLGSHGLDETNVPFEESVRVPLIVRYPGRIAPGTTTDLLISLADLVPTLLSLTSTRVPAAIQGNDLSRKLAGDAAAAAPEAAYCQGGLGTEPEWRMLVRGFDKVIIDRNLRVTHLYNLGKDPFELANLVGEPDERRKRDEMRANLLDWMARVRDQSLPSGLRLRG